MVIEEGDLRILTDPGNYSTAQNDVTNIDVILITHEHQDHFHIDSLKQVMKQNPNARIVTNSSVQKIVREAGFESEIVDEGKKIEIKSITLEGFGTTHAEIYKEYNVVENTGYFIAEKLFYPGDALTDPGKKVDVLALPVAGPWIKISEAIEYGKRLHPRIAFPVHDGGLKITTPFHKTAETFLSKEGIQFMAVEIGKEYEF
jgi:L-ascorbate metabolism protein UlaG (beta-lactamase superfamily)